MPHSIFSMDIIFVIFQEVVTNSDSETSWDLTVYWVQFQINGNVTRYSIYRQLQARGSSTLMLGYELFSLWLYKKEQLFIYLNCVYVIDWLIDWSSTPTWSVFQLYLGVVYKCKLDSLSYSFTFISFLTIDKHSFVGKAIFY